MDIEKIVNTRRYKRLRECYGTVVEIIYKNRVDFLEEFPKAVIISKSAKPFKTHEPGVIRQVYAYRALTLKFTILLFLKANSIQKQDLRKDVGNLIGTRHDNASRIIYEVLKFNSATVYPQISRNTLKQKVTDIQDIEKILMVELSIPPSFIEKVNNYYTNPKRPLWTA